MSLVDNGDDQGGFFLDNLSYYNPLWKRQVIVPKPNTSHCKE